MKASDKQLDADAYLKGAVFSDDRRYRYALWREWMVGHGIL
jgi:hypothetical protein